MSELTKQALRVENNTQFPNNNSGYITPSRLRGFNSDMIDSTVNENQYNVDSGSWNNKISSLEAFTASIDNNFVTDTEFRAYTSSNNTKVNNLSASSSLQQSEIDALIAFTGSVSSVATASLLVTASATLNVITFTKGDASTFNVTVGADTTQLNAFTASQESKNATLAIYTASVNQQLASISSTTASLNTSVANLNLFTSSQNTKNATLATYTGSNDTKWSNLGSQSGSWITETESGSFLVTASFATQTLTFTKGNGSTFSVFIPDNSGSIVNLTPLNDFTASQNTKNATLASVTASLLTETNNLELFTSSQNTKNATLATYTGSVNQQLTSLASTTASLNTSVTNLNLFTSSQNTKDATLATYTGSNDTKWSNLGSQSGSWVTETESGSFLVTASVTSNIITFTKGNNTQFSLTVGADTTALNAFTASQQLLNTTFATTGSNVFRGNQSLSGSILISGSTLNVTSGSANGNVITNLGDTYTDTNPVQTIVSITSASYAALVSSSTYNPNTLYIISGAVDAPTVDLSSLNAYTASNDTKWSTLGSISGSWITESETSSFARTNTINNFTETQNFTNVTVSGTASVAFLQVTYESSSVIYSSGSNQFGDASNDVQTLYGSVRVMNQLTASGLNYPTADNGAKSFIQTDGNGNLSLQYVDTIFETIYAGASVPKGTPLYISGSQGANPRVFAADAADPNKMPVTFIASEAYTINTSYPATVLGLIEGIDLTGYTVGDVVYVAEGGGWTTNLPSGSNSITQVLGVVTKSGNGGKGLVLNPGPAQLPGLQTGYVWVGNGVNQPIAVTTSSLVTTPTDISALNAFTASENTKNTTLATYTGSVDTKFTTLANVTSSLISKTGSYATTGSNEFQAGQVISGSITLFDVGENEFGQIQQDGVNMSFTNLIRATAGISIPGGQSIRLENDANTDYNTLISNVNNVGVKFEPTVATDAIMELAGYSLNVANTLTASLTEGYVWVGNDTGKTYEVATSSFGGGGSTNISALNAFTASQYVSNSFFATTGSNQFVGNQTITGSLILSSSGAIELQVIGNSVFTGSARGNVGSLSVTSNTASMDLSTGNYFTLQLPASATTHITATNIQPGQTATLLITTNTSANVVLAPNILEPSGSFYTASASGSKDILSLVAFDSTTLYAVSTKNMI